MTQQTECCGKCWHIPTPEDHKNGIYNGYCFDPNCPCHKETDSVEAIVGQVMYGLDKVVAENMARHQFEESIRKVLLSLTEQNNRKVEEEKNKIYNYIHRGEFSTKEMPCEAWEKLNLRDKSEIVWHILQALTKQTHERPRPRDPETL